MAASARSEPLPPLALDELPEERTLAPGLREPADWRPEWSSEACSSSDTRPPVKVALESLSRLARHAAPLSFEDAKGVEHQLLMSCVEWGDGSPMLSALSQGAHPDDAAVVAVLVGRDGDDWHLLSAAIAHKRREVRSLLRFGADPNLHLNLRVDPTDLFMGPLWIVADMEGGSKRPAERAEVWGILKDLGEAGACFGQTLGELASTVARMEHCARKSAPSRAASSEVLALARVPWQQRRAAFLVSLLGSRAWRRRRLACAAWTMTRVALAWGWAWD